MKLEYRVFQTTTKAILNDCSELNSSNKKCKLCKFGRIPANVGEKEHLSINF